MSATEPEPENMVEPEEDAFWRQIDLNWQPRNLAEMEQAFRDGAVLLQKIRESLERDGLIGTEDDDNG